MADGLPAPLLDIDLILVRQMGMPIAQIFGMVGEPRFRRHGARCGRHRPGPGAGRHRPRRRLGRPAGPDGRRPSRDCLIIYLKCSAATAARRSEQGEVRPLLAGADPVERVRTLLAAREPFYKLADYEVAADVKAAPAVAEEVIRLARTHGGW